MSAIPCACPDDDRFECALIRNGRDFGEAYDDECGCVCHDVAEEEWWEVDDDPDEGYVPGMYVDPPEPQEEQTPLAPNPETLERP